MHSTRDATATDYRKASVAAFACIAALAIPAAVLPFTPGVYIERLTLLLTFEQDLPLVPLFLLAIVLARPVPRNPGERAPRAGPRLVAAICLAILVLGWAGRDLVMLGFDFSRDEKMAEFDADIFARGALFWPLPLPWRPFAEALNSTFIMPIGDREYWVSAYLPVGAFFRTAVGWIATRDLASPLLAAGGAFALWSIARRSWPDSRTAPLVALVLYATSSQILVTSMTSFAMTMHLTLNLVWLALFLKNKWPAHVGAMLVGFLATGIHQPLFHPLFAAPFLLLLAHRRSWRLLAAYGAAYAAICAFWVAWPHWLASFGSSAPAELAAAGRPDYAERLVRAFADADNPSTVWAMAANLLRFVCWQHPLLLPLALFGAWGLRRSDAFTKALAAGIVLPILVFALLLPWQAHGWGYRYLHQVIGNVILLACMGWRRLETSPVSLWRPFWVATAVAVLLIPVRSWMAWRTVEPYAAVEREMASVPADILIVDAFAAPFARELVFNRYDLANRPIRLVSHYVKPSDIPELCSRGRVAFFEPSRMAPIAALHHVPPPGKSSESLAPLQAAARAAGCSVERRGAD